MFRMLVYIIDVSLNKSHTIVICCLYISCVVLKPCMCISTECLCQISLICFLLQSDILLRISSQESKRSLYNTCRGEVVMCGGRRNIRGGRSQSPPCLLDRDTDSEYTGDEICTNLLDGILFLYVQRWRGLTVRPCEASITALILVVMFC